MVNIGITDFRKIANRGENFLTESGVYKLIFKSKKKEAERQLEIQEPKVRKYDKFLDCDGLCTVTDVSKMIDVPRDRIYKHLREENLVFKHQVKPTKIGVDKGYLKLVMQGGYSTMKVTPTGIDYIASCFE